MSQSASASFDLLALGEVLLRLDPGESRVRTSRQFTAWEGGGEYNVARGLRRCFGLRTGVLTAFADNEIGRLLEDLILQGGVDTTHVKWVAYDGIGRKVRNPINFTERGFGIRGAKGCVDRGHSAASQLRPGDYDWDALFANSGCKWLHTGGIFAGLSDTTAQLTIEACQAAKRHGVTVSYDLNYRPSLWQDKGGFPAAQALNHKLAPYIDVIFGVLTDNEPAAISGNNDPQDIFAAQSAALMEGIKEMRERYPNIKVAAATLRRVHTASRNDWGSLAWMGNAFYRSRDYANLDIYDRIGGGDGFVAGLIYGMLQGKDHQLTLDIAAAHGALAMSTPGDTSMATLPEVLKLAQGGDAKVQR
ncbi:sugar kinase [Roseimicrobium sp. ORNL1]|uniref:sugar kinase n=1 Tax=Roseimicrobium sp. ORNL1 TaxID=2711231 RepID=UPI0013E0F30F|nr:sugar kinase [Roseimicrobium sp. ORNL1]QIF05927.1 sugar kinase [Roseimicrobium sp. ORNL1]